MCIASTPFAVARFCIVPLPETPNSETSDNAIQSQGALVDTVSFGTTLLDNQQHWRTECHLRFPLLRSPIHCNMVGRLKVPNVEQWFHDTQVTPLLEPLD